MTTAPAYLEVDWLSTHMKKHEQAKAIQKARKQESKIKKKLKKKIKKKYCVSSFLCFQSTACPSPVFLVFLVCLLPFYFLRYGPAVRLQTPPRQPRRAMGRIEVQKAI
jgi:hypothetical protein